MTTYRLDAEGTRLLKRHADWWERKDTLLTRVRGQPLGDLWMPLVDGTVASEDMDVTPEILDLDRLAGPEMSPGPLEIAGDRFRTATAFVRVPWVEAILGTPIRATIQGGSMRTSAVADTWADWENGRPHFDRAWFDTLISLTDELVERGGGRYAVVAPIMRGPSDLAEAVLGPELMCLSIYDHPDSLRAFLEEVTGTFIEILQALLSHMPSVDGGYVSPFGIWAPGTVVRTQCDASAFLSADHYAEWFLPYDVRISESVDYSIIHLHSCSLHTVDALLKQERPHAIQVTLEEPPTGPSLVAMVPVFRRILQVKPLLLEGQLSEEEVAWLLDRLPVEGLALTARQAPW
ncbi:MAG: hypothetical protein ACP5JG_05665 [Anaerolineae bacterium]